MKTTFKALSLIVLVAVMASCNKNDFQPQEYKFTRGISIFVKDGKVGTTTVVEENYTIYTAYTIDSVDVKKEELIEFLPEGNSFKTSIDGNYRASTVFKKTDGEVVTYKFPRFYSLNSSHQLYYIKNEEEKKMDTTALGVIHSVYVDGDEEIFSGFFGQRGINNTGEVLDPKVAFYWDGAKKIVNPKMPDNYYYFSGVTCVHKSGDDVYLGGKMDFPMYWKNGETVRLGDKYGEVAQIKVIDDDVYAVGFFNKRNSSRSGHTACYWKNGEITELEDNAVAEDIFIDGEDIYVVGARGVSVGTYQACYWKNGKRIMLKV